MKSLMKTLMALAIGLTVFSCAKKENNVEPTVSLTVSPEELTFSAAGGEDKNVTISCNSYWKAFVDDAWLEIDAEEGYQDGVITVSVVEPNESAEPLVANLVIVSGRLEKVVTITQAAGVPYVILKEQPEEAFDGDSATSSFTVESNVEWTVTSNAAWLTILGNERGVTEETVGKASYEGAGNETVVFALAANGPESDRSGKITVTAGEISKEFTVTQKAWIQKVSVTPSELVVPVAGGEFEVSVSANTDWELIDGPCPWCTPDTYSGTKEGATIKFTIQPNTTADVRTAPFYIKANDTEIYAKLTVTQLSVAQELTIKDSLALVAIYNAADGANWKEDNVWDLTKPMDEWSFVTLNAERRVSALKITAKSTITKAWELPAAIGDLTELTDLRINGQMLTGTIPAEVYTLTKLTNLYFSNNSLSGTLSSDIYKLTELTNLYIDQNAGLGGELPVTMGFLTKLAYLNIAKTSIGGAIPSTMTGCSALLAFMAYETNLTAIGDNWDQYPSLKIIQLYGIPTLEGPLPASIGNAAKLTSIQMKNCNFTGNVPDSWANLPATCNQVFINGNKLSGELPKGFYEHPNYAAKWKAATNILPQQEGFGLTEPVPNND